MTSYKKSSVDHDDEQKEIELKKQKELKKKQKKIKEDHQKQFVKCVENLRAYFGKEKNEKDKKRIIELSKHFTYGKDPQKKDCSSNLGKRKILPRLCSEDIESAADLQSFIGKDIKYSYCVKRCCFDENQYRFPLGYKFNLASQLIQSLTSPQTELSSFFEEAIASFLIPERNKQSILQANEVKFYLKRITQDALSSNMESRKNTNRVSYAPVILTPITNTILMRVRCPIIGIGYFAVPQHKANKELNEACSSHGCIHKVIHIHEDYIKDVYIDFGFKTKHDTCLEVKLNNLKLHHHKDGKHYVVLVSNQDNNNNQVASGYAPFHDGMHHGSSMCVRHHPYRK